MSASTYTTPRGAIRSASRSAGNSGWWSRSRCSSNRVRVGGKSPSGMVGVEANDGQGEQVGPVPTGPGQTGGARRPVETPEGDGHPAKGDLDDLDQRRGRHLVQVEGGPDGVLAAVAVEPRRSGRRWPAWPASSLRAQRQPPAPPTREDDEDEASAPGPGDDRHPRTDDAGRRRRAARSTPGRAMGGRAARGRQPGDRRAGARCCCADG